MKKVYLTTFKGQRRSILKLTDEEMKEMTDAERAEFDAVARQRLSSEFAKKGHPRTWKNPLSQGQQDAQRVNLFGTLKGVIPSGLGTLLGSFSGGYVDQIGKAKVSTQEATNQYGETVAKGNNEQMAKEAAARAKVAAALARQQELLIRYNELMQRAEGRFYGDNSLTSPQRASALTALHADQRTLTGFNAYERGQEINKSITDEFTAGNKFTMPNVTVWDGLTKEQQKQVERVRAINQAYDDAKRVFESTNAAVENFKEGIKQAATSVLDKLSPSTIAQGLVGGVVNMVDSAIHSVVGTAVTGIRHALFGQNSEERAAARAQAQAAEQVTLGLDALAQSLAHNNLGATLDQLKISLIATLAGIDSALPGKKNESQRNADRATAERLAAQQEQQARDEYARQARYAQEDLAVRNLRATGRGDEASLLALREQQQRELDAAILAGRDATYMNTLAMVQNNELLAFQNGLLQTALRNAPAGFYGVAGYAGMFATPRGPEGYPVDGGIVRPPVRTAGGDPRGTPINITVTSVLDGKVVATSVIRNVDQFASATTGAGTSRADALNRMPI